ncbi:alpha/beta fold hydrolase [Latilactobacillus sakei]
MIDGLTLKDGNALFFDESGSGEDLLFIHGYISDGNVWGKVKEAWSGNEHILAPTLEGFYSERINFSKEYLNTFSLTNHLNSLIELIEEKCTMPVRVVGWSYGASLALLLAIKRPDLVKSVFAYEPGISSFIKKKDVLTEIQADRADMASGAIQALKLHEYQLAIEKVVDGACRKNGVFQTLSPDIKELFLENSETIPLMFNTKEAPNLQVSNEDIKNIATEITLSYGEFARPAYKLVVQEATDLINNSKLVVIPGAYHIVPVQSPGNFIQAIKNSFYEGINQQ